MSTPMTEDEGAGRVLRLLAALEKLPWARGITFRGLPEGAPPPAGATTTSLLTPTSRDARVASENFRHRRMIAIAARKGRDIGMLAAHPEEAEIVFLPGATLLPLGELRVEEAGVTVLLVEEVDLQGGTPPDNRGLPVSLSEFQIQVTDLVLASFRDAPLALTSPGKFAGPIE